MHTASDQDAWRRWLLTSVFVDQSFSVCLRGLSLCRRYPPFFAALVSTSTDVSARGRDHMVWGDASTNVVPIPFVSYDPDTSLVLKELDERDRDCRTNDADVDGRETKVSSGRSPHSSPEE